MTKRRPMKRSGGGGTTRGVGAALAKHIALMMEKLRSMNRGQKKVFFGMAFFIFVNAVILVLAIVLAGILIGKLAG